MRQAGFMENKNRVYESLPKSYRYETLPKRRQLFIEMLNFMLPLDHQIEPWRYDLDKQNLRDVVIEHILSYFPLHRLRPEHPTPVRKIYAKESEVFSQFFALVNRPRARFLARSHRIKYGIDPQAVEGDHPAYALLRLIFDGYGVVLNINLDTLFLRVVHQRILKKNPPGNVKLTSPFVYIDNGKRKIRVHPIWKSGAYRAAPLIEREIETMEPGVEHYLLLPKQQTFRRYRPVKNLGSDKEIMRITPYSFTFCDRIWKKRSGERKWGKI